MTESDTTPAVRIYLQGPVSMSVCVPVGMQPMAIEAAANLLNPTGISSPWRISDDPTFAGGQPNPCLCEQEPDRQHFLLNC